MFNKKIDSCKELLSLFMDCTEDKHLSCFHGISSYDKTTCYFNGLKCDLKNDAKKDITKLINNNDIKKTSITSELFFDYSGRLVIEDGFSIDKIKK
jgi:hypothetical protein